MGFIYCLTFPNGKKYVGQTKRTVEQRISAYKQESSKCTLVRKAYEKYVHFEVCTLLETTNDKLNYWKRFYIKEMNTVTPNGYNLTDGGENGVHSDETRERMRQAHANRVVHDEWRKRISEGLMGHKHKDETKEKMRQAKLKNPSRPSEENRRKINEKIKTVEVREKGSKSRRKDDFNLPMYIQKVRKPSNPGYCVLLPGQPQKYFTSKFLSMEEKLQLAIQYKEKQTKKLEAQKISFDIINELINKITL